MKSDSAHSAPVRAPHPRPDADRADWSIEQSASFFGVKDWGAGYFAINDAGHMVVRPDQSPDREIDLQSLVNSIRGRNVGTPVLLRFPQMLRHRAGLIRDAFDRAIDSANYGNTYTCVYPIKVNQHRYVVEQMLAIGADLGFGLEAGTKPELLAVLGLTAGAPDTPIICNGFKDDEYIETVVLAAKLGRNILPVVERRQELDSILRLSEKHGVETPFGLRIKLASPGAGRWQASGGLASKFGLFVAEAIDCMHDLQQRGAQHRLTLLHCHIGSQVCDLTSFRSAVRELTRVYVELRALGAGLDTIDVGGGLGVDYDGSGDASASSINYDIDEYASTVVHEIAQVCESAKAPHPRIISESGRALVAYWSALIFDVLGVSRHAPAPTEQDISAIDDSSPPALQTLAAILQREMDQPSESLKSAMDARDALTRAFADGNASIEQRALGERLFRVVGQRALHAFAATGDTPPQPERLADLLSDLYFCNLSIFQSLPDLWALGHVFPFAPIARLNEQPTRRAVLCDITCDSDGEARLFPGAAGEGGGIVLHEPGSGAPYDIGVFLVGAYQEILGDLHNLLGDTNAAHVSLNEHGETVIDEVIHGDRVRDVLGYVGIDHQLLRGAMRTELRRAVSDKRLSQSDASAFQAHFENGLDGYTYLEDSS